MQKIKTGSVSGDYVELVGPQDATQPKTILGVIAIARTRIETKEEITSRLTDALQHIEPDRLIAAPDCGLGMLDRATIRAKLANMAAAAHSIRPEGFM